MTAMRNSSLTAAIVASSSAVLPEPGEDIRLSASTPYPSKCARLCAAARSLASSRRLRTSTVAASFTRLAVTVQPQVSHMRHLERGFGDFELDAQQHHLVAAQQIGLPVAACAAEKAIGLGRAFGAATTAAQAQFGPLDSETRAIRRGSSAGQRIGRCQQLRLDAGQRPDRHVNRLYPRAAWTH